MAISNITSSTTTYKVSSGDTFSKIVEQCIKVGMTGYKGLNIYNEGINKLKSFNPDIDNIDLIYVGQNLVLQGTPSTKTTNKAQRPTITAFGLQSGTANSNIIEEATVFATWEWSKSNTEEYKVIWKYGTGDGVGWVHEETTTKYKYSTCSGVPANATHVTFQVKPISKTYTKNNKETHYWTADWSTKQTYWYKDNPPEVPPALSESGITVSESTSKNFIETIKDVAKDVANAVTGNTSNTNTEAILYKVKFSLTGLAKDQNSGLYLNAHEVQFQILKNDSKVYKTGRAKITTSGDVSYECSLAADMTYKVRVRSYRGAVNGSDNTKYNASQGVYSDWSDYSPSFSTPPNATQEINVESVTKGVNGQYIIELNWYEDLKTDATYTVGYTDDINDFYEHPDDFQGATIESKDSTCRIEIGADDSLVGKEIFIAVRTKVGNQLSTWSVIRSVIIGTEPEKPTAWSSSSSAMLGDQVVLYWAHNTKDSSPESVAKIDIMIDGIHVTNIKYDSGTNSYIETNKFVENTHHDAFDRYEGIEYYITKIKEKDEYGQVLSSTSSYVLSLPESDDFLKDGCTITWSVMTAGIYVDENGDPVYSNWSDPKEIDVYAKPSIEVSATIEENSVDMDIRDNPVTHFPIVVAVSSNGGPNQKPVTYHVYVTADDDYETVDSVGNVKMVKSGETMFSKHIDTNDAGVALVLNPSNIDLENDQSYTLTCTVSMDSGLTAEESIPFVVQWTDSETWPDLEITYDPVTYTTQLKPYCYDGNLVSGVTLSVYRREFDGTYTELASGLNNEDGTYIVDPHPALDYARYRVVAQTNSTGAISYYDVPGFPINEKAIILQWDEEWKNLEAISNTLEDGSYDDAYNDEYSWTGSLLRLPYNIDVSDSHDPDVELIKYIGRENPVGYYGTQIGHTSTWSTEIPKSDSETLYAIRRLSKWMGNVYVREPSGTGYWASVKVSYSQKHKELTIPITLTVTRVEGE